MLEFIIIALSFELDSFYIVSFVLTNGLKCAIKNRTKIDSAPAGQPQRSPLISREATDHSRSRKQIRTLHALLQTQPTNARMISIGTREIFVASDVM